LGRGAVSTAVNAATGRPTRTIACVVSRIGAVARANYTIVAAGVTLRRAVQRTITLCLDAALGDTVQVTIVIISDITVGRLSVGASTKVGEDDNMILVKGSATFDNSSGEWNDE